MRKLLKTQCAVIGVMVFALAVVAPAVSAHPGHAEHDVLAQQNSAAEEAKVKAEEKREAVQAKLEDKKLEVCKKREAKINNIMARIADRGTKLTDVFTKIADRTKQFYVDKGRTLENYQALVDEVDAKKTAVDTAVAEVKEQSVEFTCDGTDPKGAANSFKEALKTQNEALKAYKTAVKNLIVGVKSVNGTTNSSDAGQDTDDSEVTQ